MAADIVLGQYLPGDSLLHRMDPRAKILLSFWLMVIVFTAWSYISLTIISVFTFIMILASSIPIKSYIRNTGFIFAMTLFSSFLNLFYGVGEPIFEWGFITITASGIQNSIVVAARIFDMMMISACLMFTTSANDMTHGLEKIMSPLKFIGVDVDDVIMMITISLRFIPITLEETNKIINAQKSRGADMNKGGPIDRIKSFTPIILPLFASTFRRAYELSMAMECRCYGLKGSRTHLKNFKLGIADLFAMVLVGLIMIGVIFCNNMDIAKII